MRNISFPCFIDIIDKVLLRLIYIFSQTETLPKGLKEFKVHTIPWLELKSFVTYCNILLFDSDVTHVTCPLFIMKDWVTMHMHRKRCNFFLEKMSFASYENLLRPTLWGSDRGLDLQSASEDKSSLMSRQCNLYKVSQY